MKLILRYPVIPNPERAAKLANEDIFAATRHIRNGQSVLCRPVTRETNV